MATAETHLYRSVRAALFKATVDLLADDIKVALVSSAYTPSLDHTQWADVSANEITGTGYTAGGQTLAGKTVATASDVTTFDATDVTWTGLTATMRYAVLYAAVTRDSLTNPLIGYVLLDNTPANVVVSGIDWTLTWSASGVLYLD